MYYRLLHTGDRRQRRSFIQPGSKRLQSRRRTIGEDLYVSVFEIDGMTGNSEFARDAARAVTKPDALHPAANDKTTCFLLRAGRAYWGSSAAGVAFDSA